MRSIKVERSRILSAIRYKPDTASGLAHRLQIKEDKTRGHLRHLHKQGKVRIALIDHRNVATWAYAREGDGFAAREGK